MKEFISWSKWVWNKQERWQKFWIVGMFFLGMGLGAEGTSQIILWSVPVCIFGFYITKWTIWDAFRSSWARYQEEKNSLFKTIKDSEQ